MHEISYHPFKDYDEVIEPADGCETFICIFDDVACDNQNKIRKYFNMCQYKRIDAAYLCQMFSKVPKQLIRENCNVLVLIKHDDRNPRHGYDEHVSPDIAYDDFKKM